MRLLREDVKREDLEIRNAIHNEDQRKSMY